MKVIHEIMIKMVANTLTVYIVACGWSEGMRYRSSLKLTELLLQSSDLGLQVANVTLGIFIHNGLKVNRE